MHALRRTGSTMAAEGHVFAVACSSAERPTASTGTSRPRRGDGELPITSFDVFFLYMPPVYTCCVDLTRSK